MNTITNTTDITRTVTPLAGTPGVTARLFGYGNKRFVRLDREGKGDWLTFDLTAAERGASNLYRNGDNAEPVGQLAFQESEGLYGVVYSQLAQQATGITGYHPYDLFGTAAAAMAHAAIEWIS